MRPSFGFLHIGKTAGSAVRVALNKAAAHSFAYRLFWHDETLETAWQKAPGLPLVFFVRDPVSRFVSGFNSRLRSGRPAGERLWSAEEAIAFRWFPTANDLAEALASKDARMISASRFAMAAIPHVRRPLVGYLRSREYLDRHAAQLLYVGVFEDMPASIAGLTRALGLPPGGLALPIDEVAAHRTPAGLATNLSPTARAAVEEWYAPDFELYQHCLTLHRRYSAA